MHVFELAPSGRSKCRGCGRAIEKGELRFGERLPNPFADGEITVWFHPACAAYKRPEQFLEALANPSQPVPDSAALERAAQGSLAKPRLPRIDGAERAKGQATCRSCREPIPRGHWRIRLAFWEEGRFSPGGFIHFACSKAYFEADDILEQLLHFSPALDDAGRDEVRSALR